MSFDEQYLVFDIGGTSLRGAIYDPAAQQITKRLAIATPSLSFIQNHADPLGAVIGGMKQITSNLNAEPRIIGVGFPGPVDRDGNLHAAPTVWGAQNAVIPLQTALRHAWPNAIVEVVNDVTAAGYFFVSDETRDFLVVTVGSGIGCKVFMDGKPVIGPNGRGGELGHWQVDAAPDAPLCDCGNVGHVGAIASGRGILRAAEREARQNPDDFRRSELFDRCGGVIGRLTNEFLIEAFRANDPWTRAVIARCTSALGRALSAVHLAMGIEAFKVVGGFATAAGEGYRQMLAECAAAAMWDNGFSWLSAIELSKPDDHPGLNGVGRLLHIKHG
jgi:predicted NBD/HSP70 family sugar kinase